MKNGANKRDQIQIAKMFKEKKTSEEISAALMISEKVVKAFDPKKAAEKVTEKAETK